MRMLPKNAEELLEQFPLNSELWMIEISKRSSPEPVGPLFVKSYDKDRAVVLLEDEASDVSRYEVEVLVDNFHATFHTEKEAVDYLMYLIHMFIDTDRFNSSLFHFIKDQNVDDLKNVEPPFISDDTEDIDDNFDGEDDSSDDHFGVDLEEDSDCDVQ